MKIPPFFYIIGFSVSAILFFSCSKRHDRTFTSNIHAMHVAPFCIDACVRSFPFYFCLFFYWQFLCNFLTLLKRNNFRIISLDFQSYVRGLTHKARVIFNLKRTHLLGTTTENATRYL